MTYRKALLAASTGGHLEEMLRLEQRFSPAFDEVEFVTFDDAQSRSLLAGRVVHLIPDIPPRGMKQAVSALGPARGIVRRGGFTDVISTGAAIALPYLAAARSLGIRAHYIESAARTNGPSLTGKLVSRVPGVRLYTQYASWARGPWRYSGSIFDHLKTVDTAQTRRSVGRVVVTLGTLRGYPFTRAVVAAERILQEIGEPDREVLWQVGDAHAKVTGGPLHDLVPAAELQSAIVDADLVIAHAGVGSSLRILESGHAPLLMCRQARHHEHVDDHQQLIADELTQRGLALARDPQDATAQDALWALNRRVTTGEVLPDFALATDIPKRRRWRPAFPF